MPNLQKVSENASSTKPKAKPRSSTVSSSSRKSAANRRPPVYTFSDEDDDDSNASPTKRDGASSDDLDGSDFEETRNALKRKAATDTSSEEEDEVEEVESSSSKGKGKAGKGKGKEKKAKVESSSEDDDEEADDSSEEESKGKGKNKGGKVVRDIVKAPKTGQVPEGQISRNTLSFLTDLCAPEKNDREWFWANEPVYRQAEKEWKAWIETFTSKLIEVDTEIPYLPPKDVIHRIARDIRFSNDRTPYKKNFSVSMSRTGRKSMFAHYHIMVMPGNRSLIGFGVWGPEKDQLANIRASILRDPKPLRKILKHPDFVKEFGEPKPYPPSPKKKKAVKPKKKKSKKGESDEEEEAVAEEVADDDVPAVRKGRRSVFGGEDALKVAPKGISKDHPDIDLLKLRSIAVLKQFRDEEVLSPTWQEELLRLVKIALPFVHYLNTMVVPPPDEGEEDEEEEEDEGEGAEDEDDEE